MLYGAGYFSESSWIKIDSLIHKGQYEFTRGPPKHILDEPLMAFENSKCEAKSDVNVHASAAKAPNAFEEDTIVVPGKQISSHVHSETTASAQPPAEPYCEAMAEASSDEGYILLRPTEPAEKPLTDCAHNHLDQAERPSAGLTEGCLNSRPGSGSVEDSEKEAFSPLPAKASAGKIYVHPPLPEVLPEEVKPLDAASSHNSQIWKQACSRLPESTDDFYKSNSHPLFPKQSNSRTTDTASKTTKSSAVPSFANAANSSGKGVTQPLEVKLGSTLIAKQSLAKKSKVNISIQSGDPITVIKHVSGITYIGENLRTNQRGQFPLSVFQKLPQKSTKYYLIEHPGADAEPKPVALVRKSSLSGSSSTNDLDKLERMNAAEWDRDDASVATAPLRSVMQELVRKDSVLADSESQSQSSESKQEEILDAMSKMLDKKVFLLHSMNSMKIFDLTV